MEIVSILIAVAVAFATAALTVVAARYVLRRLPKWPARAHWFWRFVIPLGFVYSVSYLRTQTEEWRLLDEWGVLRWSHILLIGALFWLAVSAIRMSRDWLFNIFDISHADNISNRMRRTQIQFLEKLAYIFLIVIAVGTILLSFEPVRKLGTSLLASAGIISVVVGFASQKMVANLLAGFQIAFAQPIRIDDAVVIEGEYGRIEEITLTYVVVRLWDLRRLIVPLSYLLEKPFENWTHSSAKLIGSVFLSVDYRVSIDELRNKFDEILRETNLWDGDVRKIQVVDSKSTHKEIRVIASAKDSSSCWDLRCLIREKLIQYLVEKDPTLVGTVSVSMARP